MAGKGTRTGEPGARINGSVNSPEKIRLGSTAKPARLAEFESLDFQLMQALQTQAVVVKAGEMLQQPGFQLDTVALAVTVAASLANKQVTAARAGMWFVFWQMVMFYCTVAPASMTRPCPLT